MEGVQPIGGLTSAAIDRRLNPPGKLIRNKNQIVEYLTACIGDPKMDASIPRRAADAVVDDGFSFAQLQHIAEATKRKRIAGELRCPPRAYFRKRCIKAGINNLAYKKQSEGEV